MCQSYNIYCINNEDKVDKEISSLLGKGDFI